MRAGEVSASGARGAMLSQKQPFHEFTFCSVGDQTQGPEANALYYQVGEPIPPARERLGLRLLLQLYCGCMSVKILRESFLGIPSLRKGLRMSGSICQSIGLREKQDQIKPKQKLSTQHCQGTSPKQ